VSSSRRPLTVALPSRLADAFASPKTCSSSSSNSKGRTTRLVPRPAQAATAAAATTASPKRPRRRVRTQMSGIALDGASMAAPSIASEA
jgi:hypothetical protein